MCRYLFGIIYYFIFKFDRIMYLVGTQIDILSMFLPCLTGFVMYLVVGTRWISETCVCCV